jgi:ATP-dependent DNA helicase RecG
MPEEKIPDRIKELITRGEGVDIEFKTAQFELSGDTFDSICAFLNRNGGHLILGVNNDGEIEGILDDSVQDIVNNLVTNTNNPQKLNPPYLLSPKIYTDERQRKIIYIFIPESSQVHSTNGKIFDRNEDGDFDVTGNHEHISQLYLRKKATYSENKIYQFVTLDNFNEELFHRVRALAASQRPDHPWLELSNEELLHSAGLYRTDYQTGESGYTLASVLIFGADEVIQNILPHYKTDALLREKNIDRYDDRDDIRTNLIESYDRLMAFVRKHLPDIFYQEDDHRISPRDRIFREVVGNLLIHREYNNPFPAKFIIEKERVVAENWNRPHGKGNIDLSYFSPYPKNPVIARFFKEIGRADELGSGIRNTYKYCKIYVKGAVPEFIEGDIFKTIIPIPSIGGIGEIGSVRIEGDVDAVNDAVNDAVSDAVKRRLVRELLLIYRQDGLALEKIKTEFNVKRATAQRDMKMLKEAGYINFEGAPKTGKYVVTHKFKSIIEK